MFLYIDFGISSVLICIVLDLIRQLTKYGPITVEVRNRQWRLGCMVTLPARIQESYVRVYDEHFTIGLKRLIELAKTEEKRLWIKQREPKQTSFFYGTGNHDWKEIA